MSNTMELSQPTVAITGAGSGLGRAVAIKLAAKGYRVFGTARSETDATDVEKTSAGNAEMTLTDITDQRAVTAWVEKVSNELGERGLDVLISNAGTLTPDPWKSSRWTTQTRVRSERLRCAGGDQPVSSGAAQVSRSHRPNRRNDRPAAGARRPSSASKAVLRRSPTSTAPSSSPSGSPS